jgi:Xaa-Pro aminopeptidase
MDYAKRRRKLRRLLEQADAILVTCESNVRYLTGFTGDSSYLILWKGGDDAALMVSDPRYEVQLSEQCPDLASYMRAPSESLPLVTIQQIESLGIEKLIIESASISLAMYDQFAASTGLELLRGEGLVESLREIKDRDEIGLIRKAVELAQRAFLSLREQLRSELTERELAYELEHTIRRLGGEGCSFQPIVAGGPRSALPHAEPGDAKLGDSRFVLVDWGATFQGYRSDLTRVIMTSRIPPKISRAYEVVWSAQQAAIRAMKPGVTVEDVDRAARQVIADAGLAKRFNHGLGHGIGLDIHEAPRLGQSAKRDRPTAKSSKASTAASKAARQSRFVGRSTASSAQPKLLKPGMVVTVEPGVYHPGLGGIRIEDDVLITEEGCEVLSTLPREFEQNHVTLLS